MFCFNYVIGYVIERIYVNIEIEKIFISFLGEFLEFFLVILFVIIYDFWNFFILCFKLMEMI